MILLKYLKKALFVTFIILSISSCNKKSVNYNNGNGKIVKSEKIDTYTQITRKHNQTIFVSDETESSLLDVYEKPDKNAKNCKDIKYGDSIQITNVLTKKYKDKNETWLKVNNNTKSGWILLGNEDPYSDNSWSVIDKVKVNYTKWTVRKLEQGIAIWKDTKVYDKPGQRKGEIAIINKNNDLSQVNLNTIALTEETDTIEGKTDHWADVIYNGNDKGWIFCGDATVERGGPKYLIPENMIELHFQIP
jgi:hypothetical protein